MYKISEEFTKFIEKIMETWIVGLRARGKSLEVKIQKGISQGNAQSPVLFVIAMMPLYPLLWKRSQIQTNKSIEKIYYLMYMDDIKLWRNGKELETLI